MIKLMTRFTTPVAAMTLLLCAAGASTAYANTGAGQSASDWMMSSAGNTVTTQRAANSGFQNNDVMLAANQRSAFDVPEPSSVGFFGAGIALLLLTGVVRRRRAAARRG